MSKYVRFAAVVALPVFVTTLVVTPAFAEDDNFGGEGKEGQSAPETYTVKPGDTLWNLSSKFLNNPWYWPKIWSYNPQLDNPNWIQPGTQIRFYPSQRNGPGEVEPGGSSANTDQAAANDGDEGDFNDDFEIDDMDIEAGGFEEGAGLQEQLRRARLGRSNSEQHRVQYFATTETVDESGIIAHAPTDKKMLADHDIVYLEMNKEVAVGDTLQIYRTDHHLRHPITGADLGAVVTVVGALRVNQVDGDRVRAVITDSWSDAQRGDLVGVLENAAVETVEPVESTAEVRGYVVDSAPFDNKEFGESQIVFIDQGESSGIVKGNIFSVVRSLDPLSGKDRGLSDEVIAKIMVTDVQGAASTGVVIYSNREVVSGDRIEMKPAG